MSEIQRMEVKCHVSNCHYHDNSYCFAPKLEVNPKNGHGASSSHEALCTTFKPE